MPVAAGTTSTVQVVACPAGRLRVLSAPVSDRPPSVASLTVAPAAAMPSKPSTTGTGRPASGVPSTRYWTWTPDPLDFIGAVVIVWPPGPAAPAARGRASARAQARGAAMILTGC